MLCYLSKKKWTRNMGTLQIVVRKASSLEIILCLQFITIHYPEVASLLLRGKYPCKNSAALSSLLNYSVELQEAVQANQTVPRSAGFFSLWAGCRKLLFAREPRQAGQVLCGSALAGRPFGKQIESRGRARLPSAHLAGAGRGPGQLEMSRGFHQLDGSEPEELRLGWMDLNHSTDLQENRECFSGLCLSWFPGVQSPLKSITSRFQEVAVLGDPLVGSGIPCRWWCSGKPLQPGVLCGAWGCCRASVHLLLPQISV